MKLDDASNPTPGAPMFIQKTFLAVAVIGMLFVATIAPAAKIYRFKCPRTNQVFEYSSGAAPRCPTHGEYHLIRVND